MTRRIVSLTLLICAALAGQQAAIERKFALRSLTVRGNRIYTREQILAVSGLELGQVVAKPEFDAARDKILATGMFETVGYQFGPGPGGQGYSANFDVVEIGSRFPVQFEGLGVPAADIEAFLKLRNPLYMPMLPGTKTVIDYYKRLVEEFLASQNKPIRVVGEVVPTAKDEFKILFRSEDGLPAVSHVTFAGNQAIAALTLQNSINDVAFGTPFTRDNFRQLLDSQIRPLYDAKGLIRVKFPMFTTEPDPRVKGVVVHVTVEEGVVYKLRKVTIAGASNDLLGNAKLKTGGVVNFDEINQGLDRVKSELKHEGYMEVQGSTDRTIDDKEHVVDVVLQFETGPLFIMGKLNIEGLDLNGEPAVRKLWGVQEGKPFNATYPDYFLARIRENGMFDGLGATKASTKIDDLTHVVDVTLNFGSSPKVDPRKKRRPDQEDQAKPTITSPPLI
jgi:outer membrane protein insertion porin family